MTVSCSVPSFKHCLNFVRVFNVFFLGGATLRAGPNWLTSDQNTLWRSRWVKRFPNTAMAQTAVSLAAPHQGDFFPLGSSKPWNAPRESLGPFEKHPKLSAGTWPKFFFEHVFRESKFRHHAMLNHKKQELEGFICKIVKSLYMFILNNFLWIKIHKISTKIQTRFNFVAPCNPFKGSSRDWIRLYASNSFLQLSGSVPISLAFDHWSWRLTWPKSMVVGNLVSQLHHRVQHVYKITCFPQSSGKTIWTKGN